MDPGPPSSSCTVVAATKMIIGQQSEPVILVGHSYGGAVITEAGNHPNVAALVYIAAFAPDEGESVETILGTFPPGEPNAGDAILRHRSRPSPGCRGSLGLCSLTFANVT